MEHSLNELIKFAKNLKLLYVEDDELSRVQTLDILNMFFSDIVVAVDGAKACEEYDKVKVDFIITDINMPKKNGIEFIRYVRQSNKDIPIFILSAHSDTSFFLDSISLGVDGYLIKPIDSSQFIDQVRKKVHKLYLQQQIKEYHETLEQKVQIQVQELRAKDKILIQQAKLATMGEMMDIVAHQWKQPINIISMHTSLVKEMHSEGVDIAEGILDDCYDKVEYQIRHLVKTLDDFRAFFRPNENVDIVTLKEIIDSVLVLIHDDLIKNKINLKIDIDEHIKIEVNPSEIKHIFINLINNSRDAYIENSIKQRDIIISSRLEDQKVIIDTCDNAGGIKEDILPNIFKANFTSKKCNGGTGMGLYMSEFIAKKNHGSIYATNKNNGTCISLSFKSE